MLTSLLFATLLACNNGDASAKGEAKPAAAPAPVAAASAAPMASSGGEGDLADSTAVATWDGGSLTYAPVKAKINNQLIKMRADYLSGQYDAQSQEVDDQVNEAILNAEAKKRGLSDKAALLKAEVDDKVAAPTDAEIQDAYNQLARRLGGQPLEAVKDKVTQAVVQKKQAERYGNFIDELRKTYKVSVTIPFPDLPKFPVSVDADPSKGPKDAPITIIQFAEFQCPYCGKADATMKEVLKDYDGKIQFVFRDFPLGFHANAIPAAVAANCAAKQGKYWEMHDSFMSNQQALTEADLERAAQEVGLNQSDWEACRKDPTVEEEIRKDMSDGSSFGVEGTPAFFINGVFLNGAQPYEKFKSIIDRELASKKG